MTEEGRTHGSALLLYSSHYQTCSEKHPHKPVGALLGLVPNLIEQPRGNLPGGELPLRGLEVPEVLREGLPAQGALVSPLPAVGKGNPVPVELHPAGLPAAAVQLGVNQTGLVLQAVFPLCQYIFHRLTSLKTVQFPPGSLCFLLYGSFSHRLE